MQKERTNIQVIPVEGRPRERMLEVGPKALADHELLAILLRTGTSTKNVVNLACDVLNEIETLYDFRHTTIQELMVIPGIGKVKATEILADIDCAGNRGVVGGNGLAAERGDRECAASGTHPGVELYSGIGETGGALLCRNPSGRNGQFCAGNGL